MTYSRLLCILLSSGNGLALLQRAAVHFAQKSKERDRSQSQKAFVCQACGRGYKYKGNLKQHQRFECGVEPQFECTICHRPFTHKSTLKTHLGIVHGQVM